MVVAVTHNDMVVHGQSTEDEVTEKKYRQEKEGGGREMRVEASERG